MLSRSGAGKPCQPASIAAASQREASASPYSGKGQNSPQPSGPAQQQGFALQDAPELHPHRQAHNVGAGQEFVEAGQGP